VKLATEAPINGGRNYDGPKVAKGKPNLIGPRGRRRLEKLKLNKLHPLHSFYYTTPLQRSNITILLIIIF